MTAADIGFYSGYTINEAACEITGLADLANGTIRRCNTLESFHTTLNCYSQPENKETKYIFNNLAILQEMLALLPAVLWIAALEIRSVTKTFSKLKDHIISSRELLVNHPEAESDNLESKQEMFDTVMDKLKTPNRQTMIETLKTTVKDLSDIRNRIEDTNIYQCLGSAIALAEKLQNSFWISPAEKEKSHSPSHQSAEAIDYRKFPVPINVAVFLVVNMLSIIASVILNHFFEKNHTTVLEHSWVCFVFKVLFRSTTFPSNS